MYLITGVAGFIGFHVAQAFLARGARVVGIDNLNGYYDPALKKARLEKLTQHGNSFTFIEGDVTSHSGLSAALGPLLKEITHVIHLAAQPGVRHSIAHPFSHMKNNIGGQLAVLECSREMPNLAHIIYASSSSVYGGNQAVPFRVEEAADLPRSPYAAAKRSAELFAECYAHLHQLPITGLRFFTAYGPWGRPDMAYFIFTRAIMEGTPIKVFSHGKQQRDYTYIGDLTDGILSAANLKRTKGAHMLYNLGMGRGISTEQLIEHLEDALQLRAIREYSDMQPGEMLDSIADISASIRDFAFAPKTDIQTGLKEFVGWYRSYYVHG